MELILDGGGGYTLQVEGYLHIYDSPKQVAEDIMTLISGETIPSEDWEGNEFDAAGGRLEYDPEEERNGGYRWYSGTPREVACTIVTLAISSPTRGNHQSLALALYPLLVAEAS